MIKKIVLPISAVLLMSALTSRAALHNERVDYKQGDTTLEGYLVYDDSVKTPKPAVLVVHQWMGLTDHEKSHADKLAELGYVAFACDIYGKDTRPKDTKEAGSFAGKYKSDRKLLRDRVNAGLEVLKKNPLVDPKRIGAIGYCFGGTTVIELARSGADVVGVVSFHGGLDSPTPADGKNITAKVLALHGADDPYVPLKDLEAWETEMKTSKVDYQLVKFGGAVHSFTDLKAGNDNSKGAAYNENADKRSWEYMRSFFAEVFK